MKKMLRFIILLMLITAMCGCEKSKKDFEVKTDRIYIYRGQNFEIEKYLEYSDKYLENVDVKIVDGQVDETKNGTYDLTIKVSADNKNTITKDIKVEVRDFDSENEVCEYANSIISNRNYEGLQCNVIDSLNALDIGDVDLYVSKSLGENIHANLNFKLLSSVSLLSYYSIQNELQNLNTTPLSKDYYYIRIMFDITKEKVEMDNSNYYQAKSIAIISDTGEYEFGGKDSFTLWDGEHTSNYGTIQEPKYDFTSHVGINLNNLDNYVEVLKGKNIKIKLELYKGLDEKSSTTFEIDLNDEQVKKLQTLSDFMINYIHEYTK